MISNLFKTAWRNISRNKTFSFIQVIGLSIGISVSLVIFLVISYDFSFDKRHQNRDRIYRVVTHSVNAGMTSYNGGVTYPLADAMQRQVAGLEVVAPLFTWFPEKLTLPETKKKKSKVFRQQKHIAFADARYFNLISYEWLAGSPETSLSQPFQVVLTESNARLYFPNTEPENILGKKIYFGDTLGTTVSGIVKDLTSPTDFTIKTFISRSTLEKTTMSPVNLNDWGPTIGLSQLFLKLSRSINPNKMEDRISLLLKHHGLSAEANGQNQIICKLQPLSDLHFNPVYGNIFGYDEMAQKPALYGLMALSIFLLLLACINFVNLYTAQSAHRAKEIGIRKTLGSSKRSLIFQFLSEAFLLTLFATLLSLLLIPYMLSAFASFIPTGLHVSIIDQPEILVYGGFLIIVVSLLSGFYPAIILSRYRPVSVMNSQLSLTDGRNGAIRVRKILTVSQFVVAQVFVIGTLMAARQTKYMLHKDPGFNKDAIVNFYTSFYDTTLQHRMILLDKLKTISGISMVSLSGDAPFSNYGWKEVMKYKDNKKEIETELDMKFADTNYCRLFKIKILAGTGLPFSDTIKYLLINETYANILGFRNLRDAVGKQILWNERPKTIVGVVADFHQHPLHVPIKPLAISSRLSDERLISVALAPENSVGNSWKRTIAQMKKTWKTVYPEDEFTFQFQDEEINSSYKSEQDIGYVLTWASAVAVFISCLGLTGLVIHTTNRRRKEIGIRKIVGASVTQIIFLLTGEHMKLIGWSFLIALPLSWWGIYSWLNHFAYRTSIGVWPFIEGGLWLGGVALSILILKTFKAAIANPAESLRVE